jgi:hypothetical protein
VAGIHLVRASPRVFGRERFHLQLRTFAGRQLLDRGHRLRFDFPIELGHRPTHGEPQLRPGHLGTTRSEGTREPGIPDPRELDGFGRPHLGRTPLVRVLLVAAASGMQHGQFLNRRVPADLGRHVLGRSDPDGQCLSGGYELDRCSRQWDRVRRRIRWEWARQCVRDFAIPLPLRGSVRDWYRRRDRGGHPPRPPAPAPPTSKPFAARGPFRPVALLSARSPGIHGTRVLETASPNPSGLLDPAGIDQRGCRTNSFLPSVFALP